MNIYEHIILTKKRPNSKHWDVAQREFSTEPSLIEDTPKQKLVTYCYLNAESIEQVKEFNAAHNVIVMSPMGMNPRIKNLDMATMLKDSETSNQFCSVTKKKILIAHYV